MEKIVILTGAGISAESGLDTFRDDDGFWARHRPEDVATPEGFARNPALVLAFYDARRAEVAQAQPNPAHRALARLQARHPGQVTLITQNVDTLHEAAGHRDVIHMHGRLDQAICHDCGHRWPAPPIMRPHDHCPDCTAPATRPDVVLFGEIPHELDRIEMALSQADIFVAIGTSGLVYPAGAYVQYAQELGAHTVELNLTTTEASRYFAERIEGHASRTVPAWVETMLSA